MPRRLLSKSSAAFLCLPLPVFGSLSVYQLYIFPVEKKKKTLKGLRRVQPRARLSKLDYFYAGITSTRLHPRIWLYAQGRHDLLPV